MLQPLQLPRTDEVLSKGQMLRERGKEVGPLPGTEAQQPQNPMLKKTARKPAAKPTPQSPDQQ